MLYSQQCVIFFLHYFIVIFILSTFRLWINATGMFELTSIFLMSSHAFFLGTMLCLHQSTWEFRIWQKMGLRSISMDESINLHFHHKKRNNSYFFSKKIWCARKGFLKIFRPARLLPFFFPLQDPTDGPYLYRWPYLTDGHWTLYLLLKKKAGTCILLGCMASQPISNYWGKGRIYLFHQS